MKVKNFLPIILGIILLAIILPNVNAACRISGYTKNMTGSLIGTDHYIGYCQNANNLIDIQNQTGGLFQWGGPGDNCDAYCGNVWINATNTTIQRWGYDTIGYPLNSSNVAGWNNQTTKEVGNVTLNLPAAPVITIQSPTLNYYYNTATNMWFNVTTDIVSSWCGYSLDGVANQTMGGSGTSWNYQRAPAITPDGLHSVLFYCNDSSGNMGTVGPRTFYVDVTNPFASFGTNPIDNYVSSSSSVTFEGKCSDNVGLSSYQVWGNWSGSWSTKDTVSNPTNDSWYNRTINSIPDGTWRWAIYCVDKAQPTGWTDFTDTNRTLTVSTSSMIINIQSPLSGFYYDNDNIWFNATTTKIASWCGYSLDGNSNISLTNSTGNWNDLNSSVSEGTRLVTFYCNDSGGTMYSTSPRTFYVDLTNPIAYTNNPVENSTEISNTVTFNLKCTDNLGVSNLILYGNWSGTWQIEQVKTNPTNNTWWNPTETIANGVYKWSAWCNDSAGRTNMTQNVTFTVYQHGGGGGGGGSNICSDTCYIGTTCPSGSSSVLGSCPTSQVCCTASYCPYAKTFIQQYSMLGFSAFDFQEFCVANPTLNQTKLTDTVNNYVTRCGTYCWFFSLPFVGKYFEMVGRLFSKNYACIAFIILLIVVTIIIIYFLYKRNQKKRRRY